MITSLKLLLSYIQLGAFEGEVSFMLRKVTRRKLPTCLHCLFDFYKHMWQFLQSVILNYKRTTLKQILGKYARLANSVIIKVDENHYMTWFCG